MTQWVRAYRTVPCGNCSAQILGPKTGRRGAWHLEVGEVKHRRCLSCAKASFGEYPPVEEDVPVPPSGPVRLPDFVTTKALARAYDAKQRQTGGA